MITRGLKVLDALLKRAPVRVLHADRHTPGKFIVFFEGDVASVEESHQEALATVGEFLVDEIFLPHPHSLVGAGLSGKYSEFSGDAILMAEWKHVASTVAALDYSAKLVESRLVDFHLAQTIGGKGYFVLEGDLSDMDYLHSELLSAFEGRFISLDVISRPHEDLVAAMHQRPAFSAGRS